jgi:hypothetical protein
VIGRRRRPRGTAPGSAPGDAYAGVERVRDAIRRQGAAARRRRAVRRTAPLLALLAFAVGASLSATLVERAAAARPEIFAVRTLALVGTRQLRPAELARAVGPVEGGPERVAARLVEHPWITSARAARVAPDTVVARVVEREPAAVLVPAGSTPWLVDATGTPFAPAHPEQSDLPRLLVASAGEPDRPDAALAAAVALAREIEAAGWPRCTLELDGPDPDALPALRVPGLVPRVVLGSGNPPDQLRRLGRVLAERPESRAAVEIDLRFAGQVVLRRDFATGG